MAIRMTVRIRCIIPGCTHTIGPRKSDVEPFNPNAQWICREHWMPLPKKMRQAFARSWNWEHGLPYRRRGARIGRDNSAAAWRIWRRCRDKAFQLWRGV